MPFQNKLPYLWIPLPYMYDQHKLTSLWIPLPYVGDPA